MKKKINPHIDKVFRFENEKKKNNTSVKPTPTHSREAEKKGCAFKFN